MISYKVKKNLFSLKDNSFQKKACTYSYPFHFAVVFCLKLKQYPLQSKLQSAGLEPCSD